ncbi:hypothetical protein ACUXZZ_44135 [Streptomyces graminifolii]|uniref:hypothetical protein n=1 Tax=Streptomyces graminifolii TaxID=1266771 RepID=UPI00405A1AC1
MLCNQAVAPAELAGLLLGGSFLAFTFVGTFNMQQTLGHPATADRPDVAGDRAQFCCARPAPQVLGTRIDTESVTAAGMAVIVGGTLRAAQAPVTGTSWAALAGDLIGARGTAFAFISVADLIGGTTPRSRRLAPEQHVSGVGVAVTSSVVTSHAGSSADLRRGLYGDRAAIDINVGRRRTTRAEPILEIVVIR